MPILWQPHFGFNISFNETGVLFALALYAYILLIWLFQFKSWEIVTPRYLTLSTVSNIWPWRIYCDRTGCLALVICSTWHLPGLNSMSQVRSHSWRVSKSVWRIFLSSGELTVRQTAVSSANNLPVTVCTWQVIYGEQEEEMSKDGTLWYTRCNRHFWWPLPLQHYSLDSPNKNDFIQLSAFPLTPCCEILNNSFKWLTLSKALLKSYSTKSVCLPLMSCLPRSSTTWRSCVSHDYFCLNLCWRSYNTVWLL